MLSKKEKALMKVIYKEAIKSDDGKCVLKPTSILSAIPYKFEFSADELEPMLRGLALDGYFDFVEIKKKSVNMYFFELQKKGYAFVREIMNEKRQIKFKIGLTLISLSATCLGLVIKMIVDAAIK